MTEIHLKSKGSLLALICGLLLICGTGVFFSYHFHLNGNQEMTIAVGEPYREKGASARLLGMSFDESIHKEGAVDDQVPGTYRLTYRLWIHTLTRTVHVKDITVPALSLRGEESMAIEVGGAFQDPGATATDNCDGDLTDKVRCTGEVDTSAPGDYTLEYEVTDAAGNTATAERRVKVTPVSPLTMDLSHFSLVPYYSDVVLPEGNDAGEPYMKETILLGDSITINAGVHKAVPFSNIWGVEAVDQKSILTTPVNTWMDGHHQKVDLLEAMKRWRPKRIIITLGANCAGLRGEEQIAQEYGELIDALQEASPDTQLIVSSLYPVDGRYDRKAGGLSNDKCNKINFYLAQMCRNKGIYLLDVAAALKDANGQGKPGYFYEKDGIHPRKETYPVIITYIRTHPKLDDAGGNEG
ncbi:immunoglobulin-like domain-containing protein [Zongyangia hominis]|uniref:DUF5011 domain-containing protein n=1 Tax=Zongyangia hominis TaxID=2763677 RepID=A0A926EFM4_9FIRM|nr:immunoglobulin-like domain-containing protein [Zongyangia hominis]MBC8571191.1 DUF5011 domain-containing protein [Zongyangia hominis]